MGVQSTVPDGGCCGMAGAFGFERSHYDISVAIGERALLPAVRGAGCETLIVADGFSCREQIAQLTDRRAVHLAELTAMAMAHGRQLPRELPERAFVRDYAATTLRRFAILAGAAVAGALIVAVRQARRNKQSGNVSVRRRR